MTLDDDASMREEQFLDAALKTRKPSGPTATGHCLCCNAQLGAGLRWCDADCRSDYELSLEAKVRKHGRI